MTQRDALTLCLNLSELVLETIGRAAQRWVGSREPPAFYMLGPGTILGRKLKGRPGVRQSGSPPGAGHSQTFCFLFTP